MNKLFQILLVTALTSWNVGAEAKDKSDALNVDIKSSVLKWKGTKKVGDGHWGNISFKTAKIIQKGSEVTGVEFVVDMDSFTVDNLEGEWRDKFVGHMKSADFFDVKKFPTSKLVATKKIGEDIVSGNLTIKGQTKPVSITFTKDGNRYKGKFSFDRTQFGITYGSGNFFKELVADKVINNAVDLEFDVVVN